MNNDKYEMILKELTQMKNQINDLVQRVEAGLLDKHTANSEAIDNVVLTLLEVKK